MNLLQDPGIWNVDEQSLPPMPVVYWQSQLLSGQSLVERPDPQEHKRFKIYFDLWEKFIDLKYTKFTIISPIQQK